MNSSARTCAFGTSPYLAGDPAGPLSKLSQVRARHGEEGMCEPSQGPYIPASNNTCNHVEVEDILRPFSLEVYDVIDVDVLV